MNNLKQSMSQLKLRFPRLAAAVRACLPNRDVKKTEWKSKSTEEVFSEIYESNHWGSSESRSGEGSTMDATASIRTFLPQMISELGIQSILDAPCGDFHWMKSVSLGVERYIGADIVPFLIDEHNSNYKDDPVHSFQVLNLSEDPLPEVDLFFCRDCLQHLTLELAFKVIENFRRSGCRYMLTTTFPDVKYNPSGFTGGMNTLNLQKAPFDLPEPLRLVDDFGSGDSVYRRCMALWSRDQLIS